MKSNIFYRSSKGSVSGLLFLLFTVVSLAAEPLRIHLISGSKEYDSETSLRAYADHLQERFGAEVTGSWVRDGAKELPGFEQIAPADLLIVFARRLALPENYMSVLRQHWEQGKPVMGIRTASHAFSRAFNPVFDQQVLGGNYQGHYGDNKVMVRNVAIMRAHPVLRGVKPLTSERLYKAGELPEATMVLQTGTINGGTTHPVTWVNEYNGGRMFYTSLGVPNDFKNKNFMQLLDNAVTWTTQNRSNSGNEAREYFVYMGTYTRNKSKGIYVSRLNPKTGRLTPPLLAAETKNPSFLAIHPNQRFLYAVGEMGKDGGVSAFSIDVKTGHLSYLNQQSSGGGGPCHLVVDRSGQCVLVANYGGGSIAALPLETDGRLVEAASLVQHEGSSVNERRQKGPHAHGIYTDAANQFVFVPDLGLDKVMSYRLDPGQGKLTPNDPAFARVKPGAGPRHFAFHPSGQFAYVINELDSTITAFAYDAKTGVLEEVQTITTLPDEYSERSTTAEIEVHPSGRFLYGSNRGHDSIAVFAVDLKTGQLTLVEHESTQGRTPRNFAIDPTGRWLLAANQSTDSVVVFRIDSQTGKLEPAGQMLEVGSPVCIQFVPVGE